MAQYGFGGSEMNADGHKMYKRHSTTKENALIDRIVSTGLTQQDFYRGVPLRERETWLLQHLSSDLAARVRIIRNEFVGAVADQFRQ